MDTFPVSAVVVTMNEEDIQHLKHCIRLARNAVERGDHPFGSILVSGDGGVLVERENRVVTSGDVTAHPEIELARWASTQLSEGERAAATMYTSGEHCPMCAAAHVWAGIGRLVFVLSAGTIKSLTPSSNVSFGVSGSELIRASTASISVEGPCVELEAEAAELFELLPGGR